MRIDKHKLSIIAICLIVFTISFVYIFSSLDCSNEDLPKDAVDYDSCAFNLNDSETGYILSQSYKLFAKEPEGVLYIPEEYKGLPVLEIEFFSTCYKITKVVGSKNLEKIKIDAFACRGQSNVTHLEMHIKEVIFPSDSKLKEIEQFAFFNNPALKKVVVGENINKIGEGAFFYCRKLENLTIYNPNPPKGAEELFDDGYYKYSTPENFVVYVLETAVETYRNSEWGKYTIKAIVE